MAIRIPGRRSKKWKGYRVMREGRAIAAKVVIYRTTQVGVRSNFMACAHVGKGRRSKRSGAPHVQAAWQACSSGRNPRLATGRALAKLGRQIAHRTGAFAGYRG